MPLHAKLMMLSVTCLLVAGLALMGLFMFGYGNDRLDRFLTKTMFVFVTLCVLLMVASILTMVLTS